MAHLNSNYLKLKAGYLFPEIGRRVKAFSDANPDGAARLIRCGIGDVTEPLPDAVRTAMHKAVDEMGARESFHGYGPEQGYEFLRETIATNDYRAHGLEVAADEIFVSDGSKCDCGNILDIFGHDNRIAVMDPVYPVYVDTNVMAGHTGECNDNGLFDGLIYLPCTAGNGFVPAVPEAKADIIYLCYPNNPTGATATRAQLTAWVASLGSLVPWLPIQVLMLIAARSQIPPPDHRHSLPEWHRVSSYRWAAWRLVTGTQAATNRLTYFIKN